MAKRELSSTLKNLKFMQRVAQKQEKAKKEEVEEVVPNGIFPSRSVPQKCVVVMEADPHPGAIRGRMSFLNFNPFIDKLNNEASNSPQPEAPSTSSGRERETTPDRGDSSPQVGLENLQLENSGGSGSNGDLKRKPADVYEPRYPNKSRKNIQGDEGSSSHNNRTQKQSKREKLDWNVARPPNSQSKRKQDL